MTSSAPYSVTGTPGGFGNCDFVKPPCTQYGRPSIGVAPPMVAHRPGTMAVTGANALGFTLIGVVCIVTGGFLHLVKRWRA